MKSNRSH